MSQVQNGGFILSGADNENQRRPLAVKHSFRTQSSLVFAATKTSPCIFQIDDLCAGTANP